MQKLNMPAGSTVFLDVEGTPAWNTPAGALIDKINAWAAPVTAAGFVAGLYVGNPQPLSSSELHGLAVYRYWRGQGRCIDKTGALAEPKNGWCMFQMFPSVQCAGMLVDHNIVGHDYRGRVPTMAVL
jgi:hypothetical protein